MRLLPERSDPHGEGAARSHAGTDGRADSAGNGHHALPVHDVLPHPGRDQARGKGDGMIPFTNIPKQIEDAVELSNPSRRDFLRTSGLLVVSFSTIGAGSFSAAD